MDRPVEQGTGVLDARTPGDHILNRSPRMNSCVVNEALVKTCDGGVVGEGHGDRQGQQ